jgi:hypothetical protein
MDRSQAGVSLTVFELIDIWEIQIGVVGKVFLCPTFHSPCFLYALSQLSVESVHGYDYGGNSEILVLTIVNTKPILILLGSGRSLRPTIMSTKTLPEPFPIDHTLTPDSAGQRGYVLVCDVLPGFINENRELIAALLADDCVLGVGSTGSQADALGIYQPLARQERH